MIKYGAHNTDNTCTFKKLVVFTLYNMRIIQDESR